MDGTVGELMERTNISHMRPAHIHFAISAPGYDGCVTHLFQKGDEFIETDVVYGVKEPLIVDFVEEAAGQGADRRDARHAVLRGEVRLRAAAEGGGARRGGVRAIGTAVRRELARPASGHPARGWIDFHVQR